MANAVRALARSLLGVTRVPTYYLPWIARPGLECTLVLSNVEARFKPDSRRGPYTLAVEQYDADGAVVRRHELTLRDATDVVELPLVPAAGGYGLVTVSGERLYSDLYVTVSDGESYCVTHGRGEWIERYPAPARLAHAAVGGVLALAGRTVPAFTRHQYAYAGTDSRSHLLVLFSRHGAFPEAAFERLAYRERVLFEYWAHEASLVLSEDLPIHRWEMRTWPRALAPSVHLDGPFCQAEPVAGDGGDRRHGVFCRAKRYEQRGEMLRGRVGVAGPRRGAERGKGVDVAAEDVHAGYESVAVTEHEPFVDGVDGRRLVRGRR